MSEDELIGTINGKPIDLTENPRPRLSVAKAPAPPVTFTPKVRLRDREWFIKAMYVGEFAAYVLFLVAIFAVFIALMVWTSEV